MNIIVIGIGGSCLGLEFVVEALKSHPKYRESSENRRLRLLSNVDPINIEQVLFKLNPEETLVVVVSKTFTTCETILNANTVRNWFLTYYSNDLSCLSDHFCAVSTAIPLCEKFGIKKNRIFGFWDWVGGRYSVTSAVGLLPLALFYGPDCCREFLNGARAIDVHTKVAKSHSLSGLMAMISIWNTVYLKHTTVAVIPYCQGLSRFAAHIQQLSMESNGKGVSIKGTSLPNPSFSGEIIFGEPGTNSQHSFFQLLHQGRTVPCEFIAFCKSQAPITIEGNPVSNHDELLCNFFAQADALMLGRSDNELKLESVSEELIPHKRFLGNRPSVSLLFSDELNAYSTGMLLSIYEHKVAIQGFLLDINSFDQWGVELGKVVATEYRNLINLARRSNKSVSESKKVCESTKNLMSYYLRNSGRVISQN